MLLNALKSSARALFDRLSARIPQPTTAQSPQQPANYPLEIEAERNRLHAAAPLARHLDILFAGEVCGGSRYVDLYREVLQQTGTVVTPFNAFQRFQGRLNLARYFLRSLTLPGARVECGVYRGASALLLCRVARGIDPAYAGNDFYLVDSFQGASASGEHDLIPVRDGEDGVRMQAFFPHAASDVSLAEVQRVFSDFRDVRIVKGWVPQVLAELPQMRWSFVHLEVDLYEPTLGALEYFYPRMSAGGIMITDDYGPIFTPGGRKAWQDFCARHDVPYVVLDSGQAVIIKS